MAWSNFLAKRRYAVFLWLAVLTGVCGAGLHRLKIDDRLRDIFRAEDDVHRILDETQARFGADDNDLLLLVESDTHLISQRGLQGLHAIVTALQDHADISAVRSVLDARSDRRIGDYLLPLLPAADASQARLLQARHDAAHHPLVSGHVLSEDGKASLIVVELTGDIDSMSVLRPRLQRIAAAVDAAAAPFDLQVGMTGIPALRSDMTAEIATTQWKFAIATMALSSLAAFAFYRNWASLLISGIGPCLGLVCTMGLLGWLGIPITPITSIVPPLVFVIGMTDSVHLLFEIQGQLSAGRTRTEAAAHTMHAMWIPCGLTSLTTSLGFATLIVTPLDAVRTFGIACAVGAAMNFVTVMLSAPLLATTALGDFLPKRTPGERISNWLAELVQRRSRSLIAIGGLATASLLPCWLWLTPDNRASEFLPQHSEPTRILRTTEQRLGGALQIQIVAEWPEHAETETVLEVLAEVESAIELSPQTGKAVSIAGVIASLPARSADPQTRLYEQLELLDSLPDSAVTPLLDYESGSALVRASFRDAGAAASEPGFQQVEQRLRFLEQQHPGWSLSLTGTTVVSYRTANHMIGELSSSLLIAGAMIFVCLMGLFRSLRLGLLALLPNLFPLAMTAAALYFTTGVIQYTAVMALTVGIALAVDDTIQFMSRFQRLQKQGVPVDVAADRALRQVGAVLAVSSVIMICGFTSLLWCSLPPIRLFGGLSLVLILAALFGDALLLPAMIRQFLPALKPSTLRQSEGAVDEVAELGNAINWTSGEH